jgi:nucleoside recognition membrane protein YjiH
MIPITKGEEVVIPVATLSTYVQETLAHLLPYIITVIIVITAILTILTKILKPKLIVKNNFLNSLFNVNNIWFTIRVLCGIFIMCTMFQIGPKAIWSENTGGMVLSQLLPILFSVFLFAGLFLPLLLDFGLLEFVGSLLVKIMRPIFNLPGSAAIDCIASWLGDGTIGVLLTSKQYVDGYYTEKEACVIGTTFSLVSITFSLVVIDMVGLSHMFLPFYLSVTFASLAAAILVPKLPPLSRKKDIYYNNANNSPEDILPKGYMHLKFGLEKALDKAKSSSIKKDVFVKGTLNVIDMWFGVIHVVMDVGTIALMLSEYTPLFQILGLPFIPI